VTFPHWLTPDRRRVLRRATKIALAAMLATLIAKLFHLRNPWFATLAAIVAVEITLQASLRTARNAIVGAGIGAGAGLAMAIVAKDSIWAVGLVVFVAFAVAGWLKLEAIGRQAAIVASVIVLVPETADVSTEYFAWIRFAETVIGIGAALLVNALILPPRAYRGARRNLAGAYEQLAIMYRLVVAAEATGHRDVPAIVHARRSFRRRMRTVDDLWDEALSEHPAAEVLGPHWRATTRRIWEQCTAMDDAVMDAVARGQLAMARDELRELADATAHALDEVAVALGDFAPLPSCDELEVSRLRLLERVRSLEVAAWSLPFTEALQVFTFVNGMNTVATRLTELAPAARDDEDHEDDPHPDEQDAPGHGPDDREGRGDDAGPRA
jgi:uncharacterized membrane protein YccC